VPEFRVLNFERGRTDNYVNGPSNAGQKFENIVISRNRKAVSRDGSELYDDATPLIDGNRRVQHTANSEGALFEFSGDRLFKYFLPDISPSHTEIEGPSPDNNKAWHRNSRLKS